ncbi:SDR family NAD(P)-dependent oxidoreductase [Haloarcula sp. Atlit-47R]|uniref:SDR family NAD(P)-dependent oxidoreductase n=1 Tax=Haloarcula sp. Atlit-47R TaxID=2282132 RepID=UPI000EF25CAF|nr:glucose 1-dehydrogenase [Haloarcula sp. Atlit-47R]RLM43861.1 SDR family NAD(P)-dependent oxidoreductase [Haloarcula sp. Atlit-47R]
MYEMEEAVALVTGAASGIGRETATRFAEEGASVVVADIDTNGGSETVTQIEDRGGTATFLETNVGRLESIQSTVEVTIDRYGQLDYVVNNAATGNEPAPITDIEEDEWDRINTVNQKGVWGGMKHQIPALQDSGGGAIVNVASLAGIRGSPGRTPYGASKHGIVGLTKSAALEFADQDVRVNAVCPTIVDTPALRSLSESEQDQIISKVPMQRPAQPEEVANAILWLCSDEASFITGQTIPVDGGESQQ